MTRRLAGRGTSGHARRPPGTRGPRGTPGPRGPRRASAGISPLRAGAALVLLLSALAIYGVGASSAFAYRRLEIEGPAKGDRLTTDAAVATTLALTPGGPNLFLLATDTLEARLRGLTTLAGAEVTVHLPDTVHVRLQERDPILAWAVGSQRFLLDRDGLLFSAVPLDDDGPTARIPLVEDNRSASTSLAVGALLDPVDFDAATRLAGIRPAEDLASSASSLSLTLDDEQGFVMTARPTRWVAIFGFYTPNLRQTTIIPRQLQALRSLLAGRETKVATVYLADENGGTYVPR